MSLYIIVGYPRWTLRKRKEIAVGNRRCLNICCGALHLRHLDNILNAFEVLQVKDMGRNLSVRYYFKALVYKALYDKSYLGSNTTINTSKLSCLISFARVPPSCNEGKQAKISKQKYMSPHGIEPATLGFPVGHLVRLAIGAVNYFLKLLKYLKLLQYSKGTWGVLKTRGNTMYQIDHLHICIATDCQKKSAFFTNVDVIFYCLHLNLAWIHKTMIRSKCIVMTGFWNSFKRIDLTNCPDGKAG